MADSKRPEISEIELPPTTIVGILRRLGPGLIIAASIVGSGELIATTITGARAGFWLMWLILIGCVIKVFTQIEFGRYSLINGITTMDGLNRVPGPAFSASLGTGASAPRFGGNWIMWYWLIMFVATLGQLGGIVGGVGQALAISLPLTSQGREFNAYLHRTTKLTVKQSELAAIEVRLAKEEEGSPQAAAKLRSEIDELKSAISSAQTELVDRLGQAEFERLGRKPPAAYDEILWAAFVAVITSILLYIGRYRLVQNVSTFLVVSFTIVTVVNLVMLQFNPTWAVTWNDLATGFSFRLPPPDASLEKTALATALATFGIIGVGANELIAYPYWCLEKGYARFAGPRENTPEWGQRAQGWMRVMRWDAWCSMVVYTFATAAFYLLGAAVLGRSGVRPKDDDLIRTLTVMYEPVFGASAEIMFLFGAIAVLYSTYYVASAGHARVCSDAFRVMGLVSGDPRAERKRVQVYSALFPLIALVVYAFFPKAVVLVLLGGLMQALCLPMLAVAAVFFRYYRCDARVRPSIPWDMLFWLSAIVMTAAGCWAAWDKIAPKKAGTTVSPPAARVPAEDI